ncbi:MAG: DUF4340 domain-containing protein [Deltaproteobacteria bacterium]|nr:DUF4340 domain-containing protein [Deltaproteobacteria bacterium]
MGARGTVIATAILLIVAVIFWFDTPSSSPPSRPGILSDEQTSQAQGSPGPKLVNFEASLVIDLRLTLRNETRTTAREGGVWTNTERRSLVDDFINDLTTLRTIGDISVEAGDLASFGLKPPQAIVEARLRDSDAPTTLLIGARNPSATAVYVQMGEGGKVYLAGALIEWELEKCFQTLTPNSPHGAGTP